jgi:hypothetical protein
LGGDVAGETHSSGAGIGANRDAYGANRAFSA